MERLWSEKGAGFHCIFHLSVSGCVVQCGPHCLKASALENGGKGASRLRNGSGVWLKPRGAQGGGSPSSLSPMFTLYLSLSLASSEAVLQPEQRPGIVNRHKRGNLEIRVVQQHMIGHRAVRRFASWQEFLFLFCFLPLKQCGASDLCLSLCSGCRPRRNCQSSRSRIRMPHHLAGS